MNKKQLRAEIYKKDAVEIYKEVLKGNIIKKFPDGFWQRPEAPQNAIAVTKYLIENVLHWNEDDIKEKFSTAILSKYKLGGMFTGCANILNKEKVTVCDLINFVYPKMNLNPWELSRVPAAFWTVETAKDAVKWLIEEKYHWSDDDIKEYLSYDILKNELHSMVSRTKIDGKLLSTYDFLNLVYPNKFKPWELKIVPKSYWMDEDNTKEAVKWLIEEKLKWNEDDIRQNYIGVEIKKEFVWPHDKSVYDIINLIYPNKFKPWELKVVPYDYWNEDTIKEATKWLIEERLHWNEDDIKEKFNVKVLQDNGLSFITNNNKRMALYDIIELAYPKKFKPWDFDIFPQKYWQDDNNIRETLKYLIEERLHWNEDDIKEKFTSKILEENNLSGLLSTKRNKEILRLFDLINITYPGRFKPEDFKNYKKFKRD